MLSGYKTYITGFVGIITEVGMVLTGDATLQAAIPVIVLALMGMFIRSGIKSGS